MSHMNTLQYYSLVEPSSQHECCVECPHSNNLPEDIIDLKNRCFKFTATSIRDIIYNRILYEQRKRIHKSIAEYFLQQIDLLDNEYTSTIYKIHYYKHIKMAEDTKIAKKLKAKLLGSEYQSINININSLSVQDEIPVYIILYYSLLQVVYHFQLMKKNNKVIINQIILKE